MISIWDNFVDGNFLLDCCLGLIVIDESTSSIRLVHKSLQDYLQAEYEKGVLFQKGHHEISHVCVTYMAFDSYDQEVDTLDTGIFTKYKLLTYAFLSWDYHAINAERFQKSAAETVVPLLHKTYYTHPLMRRLGGWDLKSRDVFTKVSDRRRFFQHLVGDMFSKIPRSTSTSEYAALIHLIAHAGLGKGFCHFLKRSDTDLNMRDENGQTPLSIAAQYGNINSENASGVRLCGCQPHR